jgi:hypothetical protein
MASGGFMMRAFVLVCLTVSAACASSHARPQPSPLSGAACATGQAPEDPYGGDAQASFSPQEWCAPGATCDFECPQGGCTYGCAEGSTCSVECDGGGCLLSCGDGATCNVECDGGRCGTGCGVGTTCNIECDGGSCAYACAPESACSTDCDGGNCTSG